MLPMIRGTLPASVGEGPGLEVQKMITLPAKVRRELELTSCAGENEIGMQRVGQGEVRLKSPTTFTLPERLSATAYSGKI